ncbi:hypothetical protein C8R42DRAFT_640187 [Lentinula raphanica]|nr:hypothetical protein C8R42DRAFT_640187 [Lentinula raphanica]
MVRWTTLNTHSLPVIPSHRSSRSTTTSERVVSRTNVSQFLDIEAIDDDGTTLDDNSDILEEDFIDDSLPAEASNSQPPTSRSAWIPHPGTSTTRFLDHLEETYVHDRRAAIEEFESYSTEDITRANHREQDWVERLLRKTTHLSDDWGLFRADCKAGSEYNILFDLMDSRILQREVRSAFYNPSLGNHIYFEARIPSDRPSVLTHFLSVHSDIYMSSLYRVPSTDHKSCLWILPHNDRLFSPGTWVKINSTGLYNGDTGLVRGLRYIPGRLNIAVLLVPRILREWDHTGPSRPELSLLLEDHLNEDEMEKRMVDGHSYFIYVKQCFEYGLLAAYFSPAMLSVAPDISWDNRRRFIESKHPYVAERLDSMPMPELWHFDVGDAVSIVGEESDLHGEIARGVIRNVLPRACEVDTQVGETVVVENDHLVKTFIPGDYVQVLKGPHANTKGLVGARDGRVLGLIRDFSHSVSVWVDVNSVTTATADSSLPIPTTNESPWKDLKVRIVDLNFYAQTEGIIKWAWPDGHGSARILLYVPSNDCSFELDYTQVVEYKTNRPLDQLALDFEGQSVFDHFKINRSLHRMKTGPEPWIGARVRVVQGNDHGLTGTIRDVNRYQLDRQRSHRASGISLTVELDVARGNIVSPQVRLDYDFVRELYTHDILHRAIPPNWRQSFFMPNPMYIPTKVFDADSPPARSYTPVIDRDSLLKLYELVGAWYPGLEDGGIPTFEVQKLGPSFVAPTTHFLCHRNLLGIPICVDIVGGPYDTLKTKAGERYVVPTPAENGAILLQIDQPMIKVGSVFVDTATVLKHRNRPKPSTEKWLMVVVGGEEEHIGKFVRRIHHFYKGTKSNETKWFKVVVVEFQSEVEVVTGLELELHPNDVEYVRETRTRNQKKKQIARPSTPIASPSPPVLQPLQPLPEARAAEDSINRADMLREGWYLLKNYSNDDASADEVTEFLKVVKEPELDRAFADIMGCEPDEHDRRDELYRMVDSQIHKLELATDIVPQKSKRKTTFRPAFARDDSASRPPTDHSNPIKNAPSRPPPVQSQQTSSPARPSPPTSPPPPSSPVFSHHAAPSHPPDALGNPACPATSPPPSSPTFSDPAACPDALATPAGRYLGPESPLDIATPVPPVGAHTYRTMGIAPSSIPPSSPSTRPGPSDAHVLQHRRKLLALAAQSSAHAQPSSPSTRPGPSDTHVVKKRRENKDDEERALTPKDDEEATDQDEASAGEADCSPQGDIGPKKGRLTKALKAEAFAIRQRYHDELEALAKRSGKNVSTILEAIGNIVPENRALNRWNAYQSYARHADGLGMKPDKGQSEEEFQAKICERYIKLRDDGPEENELDLNAILEWYKMGMAEDTALKRMKGRSKKELEKLCDPLINRFNSNLMKFSIGWLIDPVSALAVPWGADPLYLAMRSTNPTQITTQAVDYGSMFHYQLMLQNQNGISLDPAKQALVNRFVDNSNNKAVLRGLLKDILLMSLRWPELSFHV